MNKSKQQKLRFAAFVLFQKTYMRLNGRWIYGETLNDGYTHA